MTFGEVGQRTAGQSGHVGAALPAAAEAGELKRVIGTFGVAAMTANIVMGSGLFVIPGAMGALGSWAVAAIALGAVVMGAVTVCFAEASSRVPVTGGAYGFVGEALGRTAATIIGGLVWFSGTFAAGATLAAATDQLVPFAPWAGSAYGRPILICVACLLFTAIAVRGAKESARAVEIAMAAKIAPVLLFIVAVFILAPARSAVTTHMLDLTRSGPLLILGIYLFAGIESAIVVNGEVRNPTKAIPLGLLLAIGSFAAIAALVQLAAVYALGADLQASKAPLIDAAGRAASWLSVVIGGAAVLSMIGCVAGLTIANPRTILAFAQDRLLPSSLARLSRKRGTPVHAILVNTAIVAVLAISGEFATLAVASSLTSMAIYVVGCIAALMLRHRGVAKMGPVTAWRFTPMAALVAIAANIAVMASASWAEIGALAASMAIFAGLAALRHAPAKISVR